MGFSTKKRSTKTWERWDIVALVTIAILATSTFSVVLTKCIGVTGARPEQEMQVAPATGISIGYFYDNPRAETVWISGSYARR